jgi:16S rRNA (adenine1518-N6/adenine1519-N6)-dimethyltransferase
VVQGDVLKIDLNELITLEGENRPLKVVANLPYYITTPIIMGLFESDLPLEGITVMVQKEVAMRMKAEPSSKDYGALSLAVQYYSNPSIAANVPPNCFIPRPKVGSAVIHLQRYKEPPVQVMDEKLMFRLIRASFNQRRKTLVNSLKNSPELSFSKEDIVQALQANGLSETIRGEALSLEQFAALSNTFSNR